MNSSAEWSQHLTKWNGSGNGWLARSTRSAAGAPPAPPGGGASPDPDDPPLKRGQQACPSAMRDKVIALVNEALRRLDTI